MTHLSNRYTYTTVHTSGWFLLFLTHLCHNGLFNPQVRWLNAAWQAGTLKGQMIFVVERVLSSLWSLTAAHSVLDFSLRPHCRYYAPPHNSHPCGTVVPLRTQRLRGPTLFFIFLMIVTLGTVSSLSLSDCLLGGKSFLRYTEISHHVCGTKRWCSVLFYGHPFCFPFGLRTDWVHKLPISTDNWMMGDNESRIVKLSAKSDKVNPP